RQPTVSRALATLRSAFADELLVRTGRSMSLTPLATSLRLPVERALAAIDRLSAVGGFEPASAVRTFRLALPDLIGPLLVPDLMKAVVAQAPGLDLAIAGSERDAQRALLEDETDLVVGAPVLDHPELYARVIGTRMPWSVICGPTHPAWGGPCSLEAWLEAEHVVVTPHGRPDVPSPLDELLVDRGLARRIRLRVAFVAAVAPTLRASALVTSLPTPMAHRVAESGDLWVTPHPLSDAIEPLALRLTWHRLHHADEGHVWLRRLVANALEGGSHGESS
ncbi:MAG: LysR family transcriptional regulator, partial [Myxococcota bacterium]